jgi:hypothetical protein
VSGIILLTVLAAVASLAGALIAARRLRAAASGLSAAVSSAGDRGREVVGELRAELAVASLEADAVRRRRQHAPSPGRPQPG